MIKYYRNSQKTIFYKLEDAAEFIETRLDMFNLNVASYAQIKEETLEYFSRNAKFEECTYEDWKEACKELYDKLIKC